MASTTDWRPRRSVSLLLTELAAGRPFTVPDHVGPEVVALAGRHGLLGIMAKSGDAQLEAAARLPYLRLLARQRVMMNHLPRLLEALDGASIPAAVLKGPALAARYRIPDHRTFTDIDVVVPPGDLDACLSILKREQVVRAVPPQRPRADKRDIVLVDPASGIRFSLDLHWDLFSYRQLRGPTHGAMADTWNGAHRIVDEIGPRWLLPQTSEIAFLCAHAILDHRFRLVLFRDLVELTRYPVEWGALVEFAGQNGLRGTTYLALLIAARALDAKIPGEVIGELRPRGFAVRAAEALLPRTDLVLFDGHRSHPLNLSVVLAHDDLRERTRLILRAPLAIRAWGRRVTAVEAAHATSLANSHRPRLTILVSSTQRRGAEVFGERLALGLAGRGWSTVLVALSGAIDSEAPTVAASPLSSRPPAELGRLDGATVRSLREHLRESQSDVLLAFGSSTLQYSVAATRLLRHRPGLAYTSIGEPLYWAKRPRQRLAYRALLTLVDMVLSVSSRTAEQLSAGLGVSADKVRVVRTGVPSELLDLAPDRADDGMRILFLGGLAKEKDPLMAIEVFGRLVTSVSARLRLVGAGPLEDSVRNRIAAAGMGGLVEMTGSVADVTPHLSWADVLILTSLTEGLPAATLEAAAASVAVVAFDVGGVNETVIDGISGRLVGPGDIDSMVTALLFYAQNPEERRRAGLAGRKLVARQFTIQGSVRRHDVVLRELLARTWRRRST
ncbi:MAG TPA: nucleotidyltransferase family protein [Acidimicrobiia bacterium]|nr:nucleotidyltransferase family protein [Acidimicrobiia bacterium]